MSTSALDPNEAIARVREVGEGISEFIKFADAKAGLILTFVAAVGSLVGVTAPVTLDAAAKAHWIVAALVGGVYAVLAVFVALVLAFTVEAFFPRNNPAKAPLVSFPDIAQLTHDEHARLVEQATAAEWRDNYARHNATLARIATAKFKALSRAMWCGRVALFAAYVAALAFGVLKALGQN